MKADYYVGIEDHKLLRRNLLESVKGSIKILQRLELIKNKRELKIEKIAQLKKIVEDINFTISSLKKILPESDFSKLTKIGATKKEINQEKPKKRSGKKSANKTSERKTISKKEALKSLKKETREGQTTINDSSLLDLDDLESELSDIESKLKNLNR